MMPYQSVALRAKVAVGIPQLRVYILGFRLLVGGRKTLNAPFATDSTLALAPD